MLLINFIKKFTIEKILTEPVIGTPRSQLKIAESLKRCAAISIYLAGFAGDENAENFIQSQAQTLEDEP